MHKLRPLQNQITTPNNRQEIVLDNLLKHAVRGRQSTNPDGRGSLVALQDGMKELTELIQRQRQNHVIERTGRNLKYWHPDDLADYLRINHDNMPCNAGLLNNAIVIILHYLNAGAVVEVSLVIGLDNLMDTIQWSNHNVCSNNIPFRNDRPVHNLGFGRCYILLCPLSDSTLWTVSRHDSASNNQQDMPKKIFSKILVIFLVPKKILHYDSSKMDISKKLQTST